MSANRKSPQSRTTQEVKSENYYKFTTVPPLHSLSNAKNLTANWVLEA